MKKRSLTSLAAFGVFAVLFGFGLAVAQEKDAENCKDHPLLSRMRNYYISDCKTAYDEAEFNIGNDQTKKVEGQKTTIGYARQEGSPEVSYLQIRRNYGNAIKSLGGEVLFDEDRYFTGHVVKNGKEAWVSLEMFNDGRDYTLTILEVEAMAQEVTAGEMLNALNKDGFIALYINFDTGEADIKPESEATIAQIVALLKDNSDLKVSIEGHTDNVGTPASNKTLSRARAMSVMDAVVKGGVAAARLSAAGWGQERPIADNRSEDGRAKNRRVEIVKK
jgi:OOP family OmpA-OmpF porin